MDITEIVFNGVMGGSAAVLLIFTCDLLATWTRSKEHVCVIHEKGNRKCLNRK